MATAKNKAQHPLIGAIDQGTSSSRFLVFDVKEQRVVAQHQIAIKSFYPHEGWVEQDPMELLSSVTRCITHVHHQLEKRKEAHLLKAIGLTNQRETVVVWDRHSGKPLHNAIVWLDLRTEETVQNLIKKAGDLGQDVLRARCGLPLSTYFSAVKLRWLVDNDSNVAMAMKKGSLMVGTVDSWLLYNLANGQPHVTDVTNASRTMLMNLESLEWDQELLSFFDLPLSILPAIKSSSEIFGNLNFAGCPWPNCPISGVLGDQQAALVGHQALKPGLAKNTYGTGCFLLFHTGSKVVQSTHGMLATVAYQMGPEAKAQYALEGSIAIAGAAVGFLRDNLGLIKSASEIENEAMKVSDNGGVVFVPALSGLFAPHWRPDARGLICGLTQYSRKEHICRAVLEAVALQTREIVLAMNKDSGIPLQKLLVDGGMSNNALLMQLQADLLGLEVLTPRITETTSLGAAMAAARAVDLLDLDHIGHHDDVSRVFRPNMDEDRRQEMAREWDTAIKRTLLKN